MESDRISIQETYLSFDRYGPHHVHTISVPVTNHHSVVQISEGYEYYAGLE